MAISKARAMVMTRRVSPSKLEFTRLPGRGSRTVAAIGPIDHTAEPASTSSASDQAPATSVPMVAACRRRPALP